MQTDARVLLNLAAEERQQLRSQGSLAISRGKKISSANSQLNLLGNEERRDARAPLVYIPHATCPRASPGSRQVCFLSVSILVSRAGLRFPSRVWPPLYFANLASPTASFSAFSLTPSPTPPSPFLPPRRFPSLFPSRQQYRGIFASGKSESSGMFVKERRREMKFEETSI